MTSVAEVRLRARAQSLRGVCITRAARFEPRLHQS